MLQVWTDDRVEQLTKLWDAKDCSAAVIADIMHISRNSVLGKVHRLKLEQRSPRNNQIYRKDRPVKKSTPRSVFHSREIKPRIRIPSLRSKPAMMSVVSPITGSFITARHRPFIQKEFTKTELRDMLAKAAANTAALEIIA